MPERYTASTLPENADDLAARVMEPMPPYVEGDVRLSPKGFWRWSHSTWPHSWLPEHEVSTDLNAWPEVHKALESQGRFTKFYCFLVDVCCEFELKELGLDYNILPQWVIARLIRASPAERTAALLNMEAQRG